ncbi:conjugal transfer protein [Mycobacterium sp. GA-2829]|uniref:conjugal transfer protein n=1 Tax=Mycobacterium sp. GA-2829 TaxID=1772283 RepID=UPI0018D267A7|nr:conjugal transfer protein [Mycobacterium sp. GA-2829]
MTNTWQRRLTAWRTQGRRLGRVALVAAAVLGAAAGCKVFLAPDRPDVPSISQQVGNRQEQVGAFAADFVVTWLTATTAQRENLRRFISVPDEALTLPSTPAAVVTNPQTVSVIHTGDAGGAELYAATVSVNERPYDSAAATRAFYRIPLSLWHYQPRALALPARVNGPGAGADFAVAYRHPLSGEDPVFAVVRGFVSTYLTATTGLDRYVVAGSGLTPLGGYHSAVVTTAATDRRTAEASAPGAQLHVLAQVSAQTSQFATVNLTYPLTVENSGGTWMVAAIDLVPRINADGEPKPVGGAPN